MLNNLKKWHRELKQFWDKFSMKLRLFSGAVISIFLAFFITKFLNRPLATELSKLKKKIPKEAIVAPEKDTYCQDLKYKNKKISDSIKAWKTKFEKNKNNYDNFGNLLSAITAVENELNKCNLIMASRKMVDSTILEKKRIEKAKKKRIKNKKNELKQKFKENIQFEEYEYITAGNYFNIVKFLHKIKTLKHFFKVMKLEITAGDNLESYQKNGMLEFKIYIAYLKIKELKK